MNIEIIKAPIEQKPILVRLFELYAYDFTEFLPYDIDNEGVYGFEHMDSYWENPNRIPYLVYVDGKLAGFVFVQKGSPISDDEDIYDITQFFVMRKFRHKKIGTTIALRVWEMFKGRWQVRVLMKNPIAVKFWEHAIEACTGSKPVGKPLIVRGDDWLVFQFVV